jgi:hypothetical protein
MLGGGVAIGHPGDVIADKPRGDARVWQSTEAIMAWVRRPPRVLFDRSREERQSRAPQTGGQLESHLARFRQTLAVAVNFGDCGAKALKDRVAG